MVISNSCEFDSHPRHSMPASKLPYKDFKWTPKLAYAVGLLTTDGNLSKDRRHITLTSADTQLLNTFMSCLNIKNQITSCYSGSKKLHHRVQFGNVRLYKWLLKIGLTPNKSHTIGAIKIPKKFFRDFLRGHLDGDGSIVVYQDNYNSYKNKKYTNTRIYTKFISASQPHILWLHKMIRTCTSVKGTLQHKESKKYDTRMWAIHFAKYESLKLLKWLYYRPDLPTLNRKRAIAENLFSRIVNNKLIR